MQRIMADRGDRALLFDFVVQLGPRLAHNARTVIILIRHDGYRMEENNNVGTLFSRLNWTLLPPDDEELGNRASWSVACGAGAADNGHAMFNFVIVGCKAFSLASDKSLKKSIDSAN